MSIKKINLTAIAERNQWHLASVISDLQAEGYSRRDAEAFADFIFTYHATITDHRPEDCISVEQWKRLSSSLDDPMLFDGPVEWYVTVSEVVCDICGQQILNYFVDGKTISGRWALMCISCYRVNGIGRGIGSGQMYKLSSDGTEFIG